MSEHITAERGRYPWQPRSTSRIRDVWHDLGVPAIGTFDDDGAVYLFRWVSGDFDTYSLWAYALLSPSEYDGLCAVQGEAFSRKVRRRLEGPERSFAVAGPDMQVCDTYVVEAAGPLKQAVLAALEHFSDAAEQRASFMSAFSRELAPA